MKRDEESMRSWLLAAISELLIDNGRERLSNWDGVRAQTPSDLGMDSVLLMELSVRIEEELGIVVSADALSKEVQLQEILRVVQQPIEAHG